jgi:hypothetical protein
MPEFVSWDGNFVVRSEGKKNEHPAMFKGTQLLSAIALDSKRCIVLLEPGAADVFGVRVVRNIACVNPSLQVLWRAEALGPPGRTDADAYVSLRLNDRGNLEANTWSCYRVEIDASTGKILSEEFTK